jgi:hypothetical protein
MGTTLVRTMMQSVASAATPEASFAVCWDEEVEEPVGGVNNKSVRRVERERDNNGKRRERGEGGREREDDGRGRMTGEGRGVRKKEGRQRNAPDGY